MMCVTDRIVVIGTDNKVHGFQGDLSEKMGAVPTFPFPVGLCRVHRMLYTEASNQGGEGRLYSKKP